MAVESNNLTIIQGTDQSWVFPVEDANGEPMDLTEWSIRGQVRAQVSASEVLHEWDTTLGTITVGVGSFTVDLDAATSSAFEWRSAVYDIEGTSPTGKVTRLTQGNVSVSPEVTR